MRPGVGSQELQSPPRALLELCLESVVVRIALVSDDVEVVEVWIAAHCRCQHVATQQVLPLISDIGELNGTRAPQRLFGAYVPLVDPWIFKVRVESKRKIVGGIGSVRNGGCVSHADREGEVLVTSTVGTEERSASGIGSALCTLGSLLIAEPEVDSPASTHDQFF